MPFYQITQITSFLPHNNVHIEKVSGGHALLTRTIRHFPANKMVWSAVWSHLLQFRRLWTLVVTGQSKRRTCQEGVEVTVERRITHVPLTQMARISTIFFLKSAIVSRAKASVCKREKRENSHQDVNLQIPKQHIDKQMSQTPSVLRRKPAGGPAERADYHPIDWLVVVEYPELFREPRLEGRGAQTASSWRVFKFRLWNQPGVLVEHRVPEAQ